MILVKCLGGPLDGQEVASSPIDEVYVQDLVATDPSYVVRRCIYRRYHANDMWHFDHEVELIIGMDERGLPKLITRDGEPAGLQG